MPYISPDLERSRKAAERYAALAAIAEAKAREHDRATGNRVPLWLRIRGSILRPAYSITAGQRRRRAVPKRLRTI